MEEGARVDAAPRAFNAFRGVEKGIQRTEISMALGLVVLVLGMSSLSTLSL